MKQKIEAVKQQLPDLEWMKEYMPESAAVKNLIKSIQSATSQLSLPEKVEYFIEYWITYKLTPPPPTKKEWKNNKPNIRLKKQDL